MALPPNHDEWKHLFKHIEFDHNKAVNSYFKNQKHNDISTTKSSLKHACRIKATDSATMVLIRLFLFHFNVGYAQSLQTPVYGIPVSELQTERKYKPQVKLYFLEPYDKLVHDAGIPRSEGEITFRLMSKTSDTISRNDAEKLARNIKNTFGKPTFTWFKGWYKATYLDSEKGYDLRLLVKDKSEAERVVKKVLDIQGHPFERDYFQFIEHDRTYSLNPGTHKVYGRQVKKPPRRRKADVKFRYAQLLIWGKPNAINLVSTPGTRLRSVIEKL